MKKFPWRGLLYLIVTGYLFVDLKLCQGPLRDAMRSRRDEALTEARERGWVALVNREPILREQVDLAVNRYLHQRGKSEVEIPEKNLLMIRRAVLQTIIDDTLVRQHADGDEKQSSEAESAAFVAAWKAGFSTPENLADRAAAQGLDAASLDRELIRIWGRKLWLEQRIAPGVEVTEEEAKNWYEQNRVETGGKPRPGFFEPEKVKLRQILLAAGDEALARDLHAGLAAAAGKFDELARTRSLDLRSRESGGELSWVDRDRLPQDFADIVFADGANGLLEPFATEQGWHLVEVLGREALRPLPYEEVRGEIVAHLEALRAEEIVKELLEKLRTVANLHVFPENL